MVDVAEITTWEIKVQVRETYELGVRAYHVSG